MPETNPDLGVPDDDPFVVATTAAPATRWPPVSSLRSSGGSGAWSLSDASEKLKTWHQQTFGRPLPIGSYGLDAGHKRMGYKYHDAIDVGIGPQDKEFPQLQSFLNQQGWKFSAHSGPSKNAAGVTTSTGKHTHVGPPGSTRAQSGASSALAPQQPQDDDPFTVATRGQQQSASQPELSDPFVAATQPAQPETMGTGRGAAMARVSTAPPARSLRGSTVRAMTPKGWGTGTIGSGVTDATTIAAADRPVAPLPHQRLGQVSPMSAITNPLRAQANASQVGQGAGALRQLDQPEVARIQRVQKQVEADNAAGGDFLGNRPRTSPAIEVNNEVLNRVAAERDQEAEAAKHADWQQENAAEIARQTALYKRDIQAAKSQGGDANKWLAELGTEAGGQLEEFVSGAVKAGGRATGLLTGGSAVTDDVANTLRIHAEAAQRAAQDEGANRNAVSKFAQGLGARFVGSAPELAAMALGAPAPLVFGAGSGVRAYGGDQPVMPAVAQGVGTGAAFEIPVAGKGLSYAAKKAGTVAAGTAGVDLLAGATPEQAVKSGLTNALISSVPEAMRGREAVASKAESLTTVPDINAQLAAREAAVKPVTDAQGNTLLNPDEVAAGGKPKVKLANSPTPEPAHPANFQVRDKAGKFDGPAVYPEEFKPENVASAQAEQASPPANESKALGSAIPKDANLTEASQNGSTIYFEFDAMKPVPTAEQMKAVLNTEGSDASVVRYDTNIVSGARGTVRFRADIRDEDGRMSSTAAEKIYQRVFGTKDRVSGKTTLSGILTPEEQFKLGVGVSKARDLGEPINDPRQPAPQQVESANEPTQPATSVSPDEGVKRPVASPLVSEGVTAANQQPMSREDRKIAIRGLMETGLTREAAESRVMSDQELRETLDSYNNRDVTEQDRILREEFVTANGIPSVQEADGSYRPATRADAAVRIKQNIERKIQGGELTHETVNDRAEMRRRNEDALRAEVTRREVATDRSLSPTQGEAKVEAKPVEPPPPQTKALPDLPAIKAGAPKEVLEASDRLRAQAEPGIVSRARERNLAAEKFKTEGGKLFGSGGPDTQALLDHLLVHGYDAYQAGKVKFEDWSAEMRSRFKDFKDEIEPHLRDVYARLAGSEKAGEKTESGRPMGTTGIAHRVNEAAGIAAERGKGTTPEASVAQGREIYSPELAGAAMRQFESDPKRAVSEEMFQLARAHKEVLAKTTNAAADDHGTDSPEYKAAKKAEEDWVARIKPLQTEWSKHGAAQQGETEIDTGTFHGIARAIGRDMTPREEGAARRLSDKVKESDEAVRATQNDLREALDKAAGLKDLAPEDQRALKKFIDEAKRESRTQRRRTTKKVLDEEAAVIRTNLAQAFQKVKNQTGIQPSGFARFDPEGEITKLALQYAKNRVRAGITDAAQLVDDVHSTLKDFTDVSRREVAEALTGYGATKKKSPVGEFGRARSEIRKELKAEDVVAAQRTARIELGARLEGDSKTSPEDVGAIAKHLNKYLDQGDDFREAQRRVAIDLGVNPERITQALGQERAVKHITNEMYKKMSDRRSARAQAEAFVRNADTPLPIKALRGVRDAMFNIKVGLGLHGTVGPVTHAGENIFHPSRWPIYVRNVGRTWKAVLDTGYHERAMQDLENDPNFITARRADLANDPRKFYDDYQNSQIQKLLGSHGQAGNRGFDVLKIMRQDFFNSRWNKLADSQKTPEMAKRIAQIVNHSTGAISGKFPGGEITRSLLFAGPLEASRWARIIKDPAEAYGVVGGKLLTGQKVSAADKYFLKQTAIGHAEFLGTYMAALGLNQAILSATGSDDKINITDPSKGDFLRFKVKGRAIEPTGGIIATLDFLGKLGNAAFGKQDPRDGRGSRMGHAMYQYGRGKLSPIASTGADVLTQADYSERPMPWSKDKEHKGKPRYTWGEYFATQHTPIPISEAVRDVNETMRSDGLSESFIKTLMSGKANKALLKGAAVGILSGSTGIRIGAEYPSRPRARH